MNKIAFIGNVNTVCASIQALADQYKGMTVDEVAKILRCVGLRKPWLRSLV